MNFRKPIEIEGRLIGDQYPTYFIADVAANHDGDLERAKDLIYLAKEAGAEVAKFQHFEAGTIVSDHGFKSLGNQQSHQSQWKKSVYQVYDEASLNPSWTEILKETCQKAGITFMTSPYSKALVDVVDPYVEAYKIGSGDITWPEIIEYICSKKKPVLLACGASTQAEVDAAMAIIKKAQSPAVLMQCNTNYTASLDNFRYLNLNVLKTFAEIYPDVILGLSDHTPGHASVLGAVALGARVIEKHFTDDNGREGPDHKFALNPKTWREMVDRTRELEISLGDGKKVVEENEKQTVVLQRRAVRLKNALPQHHALRADDFICLRPCPADAVTPNDLNKLIGKKLRRDLPQGEYIRWTDLEA